MSCCPSGCCRQCYLPLTGVVPLIYTCTLFDLRLVDLTLGQDILRFMLSIVPSRNVKAEDHLTHNITIEDVLVLGHCRTKLTERHAFGG